MTMNTTLLRQAIERLDFEQLFIEGLGWAVPADPQPTDVTLGGVTFERRQVASLGGVVVVELRSLDGQIPDANARAAVHRDVSERFFENLIIFTDRDRAQSVWYWVKRDGSKRHPREHLYAKGQPADPFLSKIAPMFVDISAFDETGNIPVSDVAKRLRDALDVQPVTKKFYEEFREEHIRFTDLIEGIDDERDRRWYASVLLNRLMFVYFLQKKGFLNGGAYDYLRDKLRASQQRGNDLFYNEFLRALFFEGFARPASERSADAAALIGEIVYLNGGLFLPHEVEERCPDIRIPDRAFENLFSLFGRYSWNLDDTPGGNPSEINPDVLGYIFEKYINQKAFGAYYTPPEITEYLCEQTIHRLILDQVNHAGVPGSVAPRQFASIVELQTKLDARLCRELIHDVLPKLSLLDPACGSGAFLVAAMKTLIGIYSAVAGKIQFLGDPGLEQWHRDTTEKHPSLNYFIKKRIITDNLYGVDIMPEAAEIARLRLFLALVSSVNRVQDLEPLPNIDFNILTGNSLIGLLKIDDDAFDKRDAQRGLFWKPYRQLVDEKNRLVRTYRETGDWYKDLRALRDQIDAHRREANAHLNDMLLEEFKRLGVKVNQPTWDATVGKERKGKKRAVTIADIEALTPFHWGYEFDQIMNERGGFDAIITNPPWEIFKPQAKEFFAEHSSLITKNKMRIEDFEKQKADLLKDREIRDAWLDYLGRFPHVSGYYRSSEQYVNQISVVNGRKQGTDINLYKLFTEQCYNLVRPGGECGIVIPSGIYTDLGTKQLREMLFNDTRITGLFGFENRRLIFDAVDSRFKFVVLTFEKGGQTLTFPTAFMRHDVAELEQFPEYGALPVSVELVRRLSPDSLSITEFRSDLDVQIAEKMLRFPLLGEHLDDTWNLKLSREFDMINDSHLFRTEPCPGRLPLYEGKMIHQFTHRWAEPRYWVDEDEGRRGILGRTQEHDQQLDYQDFRLGFRRIASNTNTRTMVATILPENVFASESFNLVTDQSLWRVEQMVLAGVLNSFVLDYCLRQRVSANINMFFVYQLPVPRLTERDPEFRPIVDRAARLICTTPEFDDLAREVGLRGHEDGATDPDERAKLRAELDGIIAHLYGLTEEEFQHVLSTFPLVDQSVKDAALAEYISRLPDPADHQVRQMIESGESANVEFKQAFRWNAFGKAKDGSPSAAVTHAVAAFMNSYEGGTILIGVANDGSIPGLAGDYEAVDARDPGRDTYERTLRNTLNSALGTDCAPLYTFSFHRLDGRDVCRIVVQPAPRPVYVNGDLHVRDGNGKRKLSAQDASRYTHRRWPNII